MLTIPNKGLRCALRVLIPFVCIPAVVLLGYFAFPQKRQLFVAFAVAMLSLLLFLAGFEKKTTGSRRLVLVSVMIALSVAGRMIPFFKPVTALTVITAIYLGSESGFLVGSLSALLSNFYFGQGPWTPFQMLGWGLIGLFAGFLAKTLQTRRWALLFYGVLSGLLFSCVMDVWTVLWYNGRFDLALYTVALMASLPHTLLYAVSNFLFLFFLGKPFGEKLGRIKIKYGV